MKILCINPGSTSTRIAVFDEDKKVFITNITHANEDLEKMGDVQGQLEYRYDMIADTLRENGISVSDMDAVVGRGGALRPMGGGIFSINEAMLADCRSGKYSEHPSNLGCQLAKRFADGAGIPSFVVDPPLVDEFDECSRYSGFEPIRRISAFHALNEKIVARYIAQKLERPLEELNLITVHLGSGISVTAHRKGRCVDNTFGSGGDGPFSPERAGRMPVLELARRMSKSPESKNPAAWKRFFSKQSGLVSYLGTNDVLKITERMESGDALAKDLLDGMAHMIAREIAAYAAGLEWQVDGIGITGAIARSGYIVGILQRETAFIAESFVFPGEFEMEGLADGGLRALRGEEVKEY